jgi:transcription factor SFP1
LLLSKPFRCPKPNCNKSYKQANGLKYHMTHGSCNFAPPKDLEQVQALLASKRSAREAAGQEDQGITEGELREVEREAERRLRPFACGVSDCQRRYKNMNGLRYHYQHSGDHGAIGLALLASGQHECLQHAHGRSSNASSRHSTPATSGHSTPVGGHSTPSYAQQYQQQMLYSSAHQQYLRQQQQALHTQVQMGYSAGSTEAVPIVVAQH